MSDDPRRPRSFRLDDDASATRRPDVLVEEKNELIPSGMPEAVSPEEGAVEAAQASGVARRRLLSWGGLFWTAASALVSLAVALWIDRLIEAAFAKFVALGWIAAALTAVVLLALCALGLREMRGVWRQRKIAELHARLASAHTADDRDAARKGVRELVDLYAARPATAAARRRLADLTQEIVDARDLLDIAERSLIEPLDLRVRGEIARAARRVSVVTTISPRALLDVAIVLAQAVRLVRQIAEIYGGRPGLLGLARIGRSVLSHIAITGGMAVGDSLVQQIVGHGLAARLSARLGEGVLNGLLTTRVGLSAMAVCRPLPFFTKRQPGVADVAPFLFGKDAS